MASITVNKAFHFSEGGQVHDVQPGEFKVGSATGKGSLSAEAIAHGISRGYVKAPKAAAQAVAAEADAPKA